MENMTMKKLVSLVMALVLLAAVPVYGDSFFPRIPSNVSTARSEYVPSYGVFMSVTPPYEASTSNL